MINAKNGKGRKDGRGNGPSEEETAINGEYDSFNTNAALQKSIQGHCQRNGEGKESGEEGKEEGAIESKMPLLKSAEREGKQFIADFEFESD